MKTIDANTKDEAFPKPWSLENDPASLEHRLFAVLLAAALISGALSIGAEILLSPATNTLLGHAIRMGYATSMICFGGSAFYVLVWSLCAWLAAAASAHALKQPGNEKKDDFT